MFRLVLTSFLLGIGLAMDACAVSMTNGFYEPKMKLKKMLLIAFMFGFFQFFMPLVGFFIGFSVVKFIERFIPLIALFLLGYLGIKLILESKKKENEPTNFQSLTFVALFVQAVATSIDALSVGLTFATYSVLNAVIASLIIGIVTFTISFFAIVVGKKFGTKLKNKASLVGGIVLIAIGIEIFVTSMFF